MLAGCRSIVMSCVLPFISTLSVRVRMVSGIGFFFFLGRFYLSNIDSRQFGARVSSRCDRNSSRLSFEVAIQGHSHRQQKLREFTSCACVRSCRGGSGAMNVRFKIPTVIIIRTISATASTGVLQLLRVF